MCLHQTVQQVLLEKERWQLSLEIFCVSQFISASDTDSDSPPAFLWFQRAETSKRERAQLLLYKTENTLIQTADFFLFSPSLCTAAGSQEKKECFLLMSARALLYVTPLTHLCEIARWVQATLLTWSSVVTQHCEAHVCTNTHTHTVP